jgi:HPt (histidine-containing phosphotransfer) domain-containing protein
MGDYVAKVERDLEDLIPRYLASVKQYVLDMQKLLAAADLPQVARIAHNLKGSGGGYGFMPITEMGAAIETAAKNGDGSGIPDLLARLQDYASNVRVEFV